MAPLRNLLANTTPKGKAALAASALGIVVVLFVLLRVATSPSYTTLLSGLDPAETGKITAALDEKGVPYELQNNGTALAVDKGRTAEARVALAEQGLPGQGSKPGFELFDKQKLGASEFQQKVSYQRALEGEIARTIEGVQGVSGAQVQLVLPEDQLFKDEQSPASAAVLLSGNSTSLEPSSVRGIAQLVSSSVKGLKGENVSITDSSGQLLWPREGETSDAEGGGSATTKQLADARYERALEGDLNAMLAQTVGPGAARVQVKADVDADQSTRDSLRYARRGTPLKRQTEKERLRGGGTAPGGAAGTAGNIPSYVQGEGSESRYDRETVNEDLGVNKEVTRTKVAPGNVRRQSVSLLLADTVPPAAVPEIRRAVEAAAGIDAERGDTFSVSQFDFTKAQEAEEAGTAAGLLGYAKYAALAIAMLAFLILLSRHLRRREDEALAQPTWLREIEAPTPLAELETHRFEIPEPEPFDAFEPIEQVHDPTFDRMKTQVEDVATREPERVAQQVRAWMQAD